jgi:diguanylate cyclase (GGDEF)-like protein
MTRTEWPVRVAPTAFAGAFLIAAFMGQSITVRAILYQLSVLFVVVVLARAVRQPRIDRIGVWALAIAAGFWGIGSLIGVWVESADNALLYHFGYLAFYPFAMLAYSRLLARRPRLNVGELITALMVALGSASVIATFYVYISGGTETLALGNFLNLFYPIADILLISYALGVGVLLPRVLTPRAILLIAGTAVFVVFDLIYVSRSINGTYESFGVIDVGWLIGFVLIAEAPYRFMEERQQRVPRGWVEVGISMLALVLLLADTFDLADFAWYTQLPASLTLLLAFTRLLIALQQSRRLADEQVLARTDELTGLPNRRRFVTALASAQDEWRASGTYGAVMLLDLDGFKEINDTLGHQTGDELLKLVSNRLQDALPRQALLARLGGDEFGVILLNESDMPYALTVAAALRGSLEAPLEISGVRLRIDVSVGIAIAPDHGATTSDLLRHADVAMYRAKRSRSGAVIFDPAIDTIDGDRLGLAEELREAAEHGQLVLHYQPKIDLESNTCVELEALVRWQHPRLGLLGAAEFLPLAERTGLIIEISEYVLREAIRQVAEWRANNLDVSVAINVNAAQIENLELVEMLRALITEFRLEPSSVILEITEEVLVKDPTAARTVINAMDQYGVRVAIDDFGTGYSSLSYLQHLPVHELKLDRTFVADLGSDDVEASTRARAVAKSVIDLARSLGMTSSAEGVERREQLAVLSSIGCDSAQGFLFAPPMSAVSVSVWLASRRLRMTEVAG